MATYWDGILISERSLTKEEIAEFARNPRFPSPYLADPTAAYRPAAARGEGALPATAELVRRLPGFVSPAPATAPGKPFVPPSRRSLPCIHLQGPTGERKNCEVCGGKKDIEVRGCGKHGKCTTDDQLITREDGRMKAYPWCKICRDYAVALPSLPAAPAAAVGAGVAPDPALIPTPTSSLALASAQAPPSPPPVVRALKWVYGVTTVPSRRRTLFPETMKSLSLGGFPRPWVFLDGATFAEAADYEREAGGRISGLSVRNPKILTYGNWLLALIEMYLREPKADRYAMFQDDLVTYRNCRAYLDRVEYPARGYLNLYTYPENHIRRPGGERSDSAGKVGWFPSNQRGKGAVALAFSQEAVRHLLVHRHLIERIWDDKPERSRKDQYVDGAVVDCFRYDGWKEYVHHPSLVQHTGVKSAIGSTHNQQPFAPSFRGEEVDALTFLKDNR